MSRHCRTIGSRAPPPSSHVLLWLAIRLPFNLRLPVDLSYGVFMYHWPLQQLLVLTAAFALPTWAFVVVSLGLSAPVALLSWKLVEKPALAKKNWVPPWSGARRRQLRDSELESAATSTAAES